MRLAEEIALTGCTLVIDADSSVEGEWDPARLEQVLTSLLANAMKYGPGKPIEVSVRGGRGVAEFAIRDHGIGIAPEKQATVWGRFERAVSSTQYGGLGLGLYVARQIVEAHRGSVAVSSAPGAGSTFTVQLPRDAE
jgi:signal transduction histidine kinase